METNQTAVNQAIKKEDVGYLKSALNLQQGTLTLTADKLTLTAHKTTVGMGLLGGLLKKQVEKDNTIFNLGHGEILAVNRGKHGVQTNVLEIIDNKNNTHRMIVKNYHEWADAIKQTKK